MNFRLVLVFVALFAMSGCVADLGSKKTASADTPNAAAAADNAAGRPAGDGRSGEVRATRPPKESRSDCLGIKVPDRKVDARQTFPIDFEPFRGSCFVTLHDPQYTDPPLHSEFFVYKDGREAYRFPAQFNGVTIGCWIEAVSFQDLNEDNLTDVVVAGMCSAKSAPYSENMVYVNRGSEFTTSEEANYELQNFRKIKDIVDFVKKNEQLFFR